MLQEMATTLTSVKPVTYAGFWRRFLAYIIDAIIMGIVSFIVFLPFLAVVGLGALSSSIEERDDEVFIGLAFAILGTYFLAVLICFLIRWLYFAIMESINGATVGKMVLGIKVTDMNGCTISFGRATGRYFGKILSGLILYVGFIMAGFTQQKQALHDIIAGTLVVNR